MARRPSVQDELRVLLPGSPPLAPPELTGAQVKEWDAIVGSLPANRFSPEAYPLLVNLCRSISYANSLAAWLDANPIESLKGKGSATRYRFTLNSFLALGKQISSLSTKLRLGPQSRYLPAYGRTVRDSQERDSAIRSGKRPWHIYRDDDDDADDADNDAPAN